MPILPKLKNHTFLQIIKTHPHKYPFCRNTLYFFNAVNLLILSVFALDALTWFQNSELGRHNMFAYHWALSSTKKRKRICFANMHTNLSHQIMEFTFMLEQSIQIELLNPVSLTAPFLDRSELQFAFQLDLHRLNSGPDSCGRHALSTSRAHGGLLRFSLR